ncbi:MAG: biotin transporter BioY [Bacteroidetes bacterium]|nr:MAG: biotin transporter BioY [Bacteroidota bacterium]
MATGNRLLSKQFETFFMTMTPPTHPLARLALAVLFISLFAQLTLTLPYPSGGIPVTGQTFAVLLTGYLLGKKYGALAILIYILLGVVGLPVFADGESGIEVLTGGSGGYLIGFIAGAALTGFFAEKGWDRSFPKSLLAMTLGTLLILLFGIGRLAQMYTLPQALEWGLYPFIPGAIVKIILGAAVMPIYYRITAGRDL